MFHVKWRDFLFQIHENILHALDSWSSALAVYVTAFTTMISWHWAHVRPLCLLWIAILAVRGVSHVFKHHCNSTTRGWFGIFGGTHEKDCVLFMSWLKTVSGSSLPYKIVIESWNTHASFSSQEALLWKVTVWGSREKRERLQSVPLTSTLPASYSLFLPPPLFSTPRATSRSNKPMWFPNLTL